jgi:hypothetical protein
MFFNFVHLRVNFEILVVQCFSLTTKVHKEMHKETQRIFETVSIYFRISRRTGLCTNPKEQS